MFLLFGLGPAAVVAAAGLLIGIATAPPRFIAHAAVVIDWKSMPSVLNDETAEKVRNIWRKQIVSEVTGMPNSEEFISDILDRADGFSGDEKEKTAIISRMQRHLRVTLASQGEDCDRFDIEIAESDLSLARTEGDWMMSGTIAKLKDEAKAGGGLAALRSGANVGDVSQKEEDLKAEETNLEASNSRPFSDDVQNRHDQIEAELNKLEVERRVAGFGLFANIVDTLFNDSIKASGPVQVERRSAGYGLGVLLAAVVLGGLAGFAGLLLRQAVVSGASQKTSTSNVPPAIRPKPPPIAAPPVIVVDNNPKPPLLPPPLGGP